MMQSGSMSSEQVALIESGAAEWGNIKDVVNAPLIGVLPDESWFSVALFWLLMPFHLIAGIMGGLVSCVFIRFSIGDCIPCSETFSVMGSVMRGRPFWLSFVWWRYMIMGLVALLANGASRLGLFIWEWEAFGKGRYWWHGAGLWMWSYQDCDRVLKSQQLRKPAFGALPACIPDLFAQNLLIFLPNSGGSDSEWASIRRALHDHFLNAKGPGYTGRVADLRSLVATEWMNPRMEDFNDTAKLQKLVSKCMFYVMFGIWIEDTDADILRGWRTLAGTFILPRLIQRAMFNTGISKVKKLRINSVAIIEKYSLQSMFFDMNASMPQRWRRTPVVKLADEIMFACGFAGIGGTCAAVESVASFLQVKIPAESAAKHINFGVYSAPELMIAKYAQDPEAYIRETLRMDPPVTSATACLKEVKKVELAGRTYNMTPGLLNQYVVSMANRDPSVFPEPELFNPDRTNLKSALTWNGAFGAANEGDYPRICPGRYLSLEIVKVIIGHGLGLAHLTRDANTPSRKGCC